MSLNFKLRNGVGTGNDCRIVVIGGVVIDTVQQKVIVLDPVSINADQQRSIERIIALWNIRSGREHDQLREIPAVQWQIADAAGGDHLAQRRRLRLEDGRRRLHFDGLSNVSDLQLKIDSKPVLHLQRDSVSNYAGKPLGVYFDRVAADLQRGCNVDAVVSCCNIELQIRIAVRDYDLSSRDRQPAGIGNQSCNDSGVLLCLKQIERKNQGYGRINRGHSGEAEQHLEYPHGSVVYQTVQSGSSCKSC